MDVRSLCKNFSVTGQIALEDLETVKKQGFKSIMICRPDGEENQPISDKVQEKAASLGMQASYVPLEMGQNPLDVTEAFEAEMAVLPGPTLGYCKSGMRAAILWALSQRNKQSNDAILSTVNEAGFNSPLLESLLG